MGTLTRRLVLLLLLCTLGGALWYLATHSSSSLRPGPPPVEPIGTPPATPPPTPLPDLAAGPTPAPATGQTTASPGSETPVASPPPPESPFQLGSADTSPAMDPATVLGNMRNAVNHYGSMFGGNPVGTNPEITRALNGENPRQAKFISEDLGLRINGRGELVDYWGTPFFFHQLSGTEMEIRSAGPDKKLWTADDLVIK
ncbi:MAG TPA: hypothetical protein VMU04_02130 [Candidatus Acidoferrum sp.]|nr:hypothetical protein [Candidatus Acidoferrum sp.]